MIGAVVIEKGESHPLGATSQEYGVNFAVFSGNAHRMELLFFDAPSDTKPAQVFELDPIRNETAHYWHCFIPGARRGQLYGWRADGPCDPRLGHTFNADALLLDPYGRAIANTGGYDRFAPIQRDQYTHSLKSVVDGGSYDWEGDTLPKHPFSQTIIYEMHVAGFTKNPNSGVSPQTRGTYRGLIEKIPYLVDLGVTAVELLPVFQFDTQDAPGALANYWGYSPISFFAPHAGYAASGDGLGALDEFRDMVKALHSAGLEVILDVVYNHTAEGDERGPTHSLRGFDSKTYYQFDKDGKYANYSGCGNTINANVSVVRRMILDSLRYWVQEMHIDGFRFDLASILSRGPHGEPMTSPPLLWDAETDPVLAPTKLIAEAWDAAGLYQVGEFFGHHWREWNGKFRDDVRAFFRGDHGSIQRFAPRILGSPDLYQHREVTPERSVNFITSHDGFTLNDLVSYSRKYNEANGEGNRDGDDHNYSWNCGIEGPSDDSRVEALRDRQIRNFLTMTLISLGAPMLLMGDEVRRTQRGNNNAYCQDNEVSWFDWSQVKENAGLRRFVRELIRLRRGLVMNQDTHGRTLTDVLDSADLLTWHGVERDKPDWADHSHSLMMETRGPSGHFLVIVNAHTELLSFELPKSEKAWRILVDTSNPSPTDLYLVPDAPVISKKTFDVDAHSVVILLAAITET